MLFSSDSDVTLVVTSCGRFDLLRHTLETFDTFNTAPIREVFITEDSGDRRVEQCIPLHWKGHVTFFVNNPRLGQLRSVDLAYASVKTPWVFHCEDDWVFYRPGFVEESRLLLEADTAALQVWLRSFAHDLQVHSPYVFRHDRQVLDGIAFYRVGSEKEDWQGFSFNPGLRRLADYQAVAPFAQYGGEKDLSRIYAGRHRYALILESDAVLHTGFAEHVSVPEERRKKKIRKRRERLKMLMIFVSALLLGKLL